MTTDPMTDRFDKARKRFEVRLDELSADIQLFESRLNAMNAEARVRAEKELKALRERRDALRDQLGKAQASASEAAADLEKGLEKAWDDISDALDKARARFK